MTSSFSLYFFPFSLELGIKVTSTSDANNQPTEAIPSGAYNGQPSTECVDMIESDEEVASTDAISELSTSADMPGSPPPENEQKDPVTGKAILVRERNARKREPKKLKDNLHSGVLDDKEKRTRRRR